MLTYHDDSHTYYWHGVEVPSLSSLMEELGWGRGAELSQVNAGVLEFARVRGQQVHEAIDRYLAGDAGFAESLSQASEPFFDSFLGAADKLPLSDKGVSELPAGGWCGYGTTPDRSEPEALIEWKATSRLHPAVWIQLAGQEYALSNGTDLGLKKMRPRIAVLLLKTGKPARIYEDKEPERTMRLWKNSLDSKAWKEDNKW